MDFSFMKIKNKQWSILAMKNSARLDLTLEFGSCNGTMLVDIINNNETLYSFHNVTEQFINVSTLIELPSQLKFIINGKNPRYDTKVDADGRILADKFVKLANMSFGYVPVTESTLFSMLTYTPYEDPTVYHDIFWGFNGEVTIDFSYNTVIEWHLRNNNKFNLKRK